MRQLRLICFALLPGLVVGCAGWFGGSEEEPVLIVYDKHQVAGCTYLAQAIGSGEEGLWSDEPLEEAEAQLREIAKARHGNRVYVERKQGSYDIHISGLQTTLFSHVYRCF